MAAVSLRSDYSRHVCASYLGVDVRFSKFITPRVSLVVFMEMSAFDQKQKYRNELNLDFDESSLDRLR